MQSWITRDGMYYESEIRLHPTDMNVQRRPNKNCSLINGQWVSIAVEDDYSYPEVQARRQPTPKEEPSSKKDTVILSNDTRVMFGVKEIFMIATFIITATVTWQDTNAKIIDNTKVSEQIDTRVKTNETEIRVLEKQHRMDILKLEQNIRELEQIIFTKKGK